MTGVLEILYLVRSTRKGVEVQESNLFTGPLVSSVGTGWCRRNKKYNSQIIVTCDVL